MKKLLSWPICSGICLCAAILSVSLNIGYSTPSEFENKIVKKIEFIGMRKLKDGKIEYMELRNTDPDDLLDVCLTEVGLPLKADEIREDITAIFKEGQLADVKVVVKEFEDGVYVRFYCEERPIIAEIEFKGLGELQSSSFSEKPMIQRNDILREDLIEKSIQYMKSKYIEAGLFNVLIRYEIERIDDEDKNAARVIFIVDEGEEINIVKISLLGTIQVPDSALRNLMQSKEEGLFVDGDFNRMVYEEDKTKILAYYRQLGYIDAEIIEDTVEYEWIDPFVKEKRGLYITIKIKEGDKYYFDGYTLEGNTLITTKEFEDRFLLRNKLDEPSEVLKKGMSGIVGLDYDPDVVLNDLFFQQDRFMITNEYGEMGYIFARVIPTKSVEEREVSRGGEKVKRKYVKFHLRIIEGKQAYIENIIIKGNRVTKDKVIRRELLVKEGELFNSKKVQMSRERVFALGYFKAVNIEIRPGSRDDMMNLILDVEEQPTGTVSLGGGYGTATGFSIFADIGQNNLMGNGQQVNLRMEYGTERSSAALSFKEPWLFDYPVAFTTSIFYSLYTYETSSIFSNTDEESEYRKQSYGYTLGLAYRFWYFYGIGTTWRHSFKSIISTTGNSPDSILLEQELGLQEKRQMSFYLYRNSRDNPLNPTKGWYSEMRVSFVGGNILHGDDHYIMLSPSLELYYSPFNIPFTRQHPCVIQLRGSGDFLRPPLQRGRVQDYQNREDNSWLESDDLLKVGGAMRGLRGWSTTDSDLPDSWTLGLYHRVLYGAEFRIPVEPRYFWVVFYFDAAALFGDSFWEETLTGSEEDAVKEDRENGELYSVSDIGKAGMDYYKYSWGVGFKVQIPMMPLRFWWGKKLDWVGRSDGYFEQMDGWNFEFAIGDITY